MSAGSTDSVNPRAGFFTPPSRQAEKTARGGADLELFLVAVGLFPIEAPDGGRPCGIIGGASHDVQVHLPDDIADAGDVELFRLKVRCDKFRDSADRGHDFIVLRCGKLVEILDAVDLRDEKQPWENRVVLQKKSATTEPAEFVASSFKLWVEFKCHEHHTDRIRAGCHSRMAYLAVPAKLAITAPLPMNILRRLYPLDQLPRQRQLWAWISFDVANQSFTLIINTLLFSIFFSQVVVRNDAIDDRIWALTYGGSMLLTALVSPLAGAAADERAWKKRFLIGSGLICGLLTCALGWIRPGQIGWAVLIYIPANFAFSIGENFLASFLPSLAKPNQVGRVSGFSWACAYGAALVLLILTAGSMILFHLEAPNAWRPFFVFAGLWFIAFTIPAYLWLEEPQVVQTLHPRRNLFTAGFVRLAETLREFTRYRDLGLLMLSSLFYGTGMSVVVFFASKLAAEYGFQQVDLVVFVAVITVSGIIGTIVPTLYQDRFGHRRSVVIFLLIWLLTALGFALYAHLHEVHALSGAAGRYPTWPLWGIGNLLGFGLGSLGSSNRAFVSYMAPPNREAEVFGIWGLMWKLSAVTTFPFAWVKDTVGTAQALLVLAAFLTVGLVLTLRIDERRGLAAAHAP